MRHLKVFGALVVAITALSALPALASAAGGLKAESYPATVIGTPTVSFFAFAGTEKMRSCEGPQGEKSISGPTASFVVSSSLKCGGVSATMNGCQFEYRTGSANSLDIGPPGCGPITNITVSGCAVSIPAQTGIPASFTNQTDSEGNKYIQVDVNASVKYTSSCTGDLKFIYGATLEAKSGAVKIDLESVDTFGGAFWAGSPPTVQAESFPMPLVGAPTGSKYFTMGFSGLSQKLLCTTGSGSANLLAATASLPISVSSLSGCTFGTQPATVKMNSCNEFKYGIGTTTSGPWAFGSLTGLSCTKAGDTIEIVAPECTIKVAGQEIVGSALFTNEGSGTSRTLRVEGSAEKLTSSFEAGICVLLGKSHTATLDMGVMLSTP